MFLIAPKDQDGFVRLYLGHTSSEEPLGTFNSALQAFGAIFWQKTGCPAWDAIDSTQATSMAMDHSRWQRPGIATPSHPRDTILHRDTPEEIPPQEPPQDPA